MIGPTIAASDEVQAERDSRKSGGEVRKVKFEKPTCRVDRVDNSGIGDFNPADICAVVAAGITAVAIIIAD